MGAEPEMCPWEPDVSKSFKYQAQKHLLVHVLLFCHLYIVSTLLLAIFSPCSLVWPNLALALALALALLWIALPTLYHKETGKGKSIAPISTVN